MAEMRELGLDGWMDGWVRTILYSEDGARNARNVRQTVLPAFGRSVEIIKTLCSLPNVYAVVSFSLPFFEESGS
jgi:hypothetical protein